MGLRTRTATWTWLVAGVLTAGTGGVATGQEAGLTATPPEGGWGVITTATISELTRAKHWDILPTASRPFGLSATGAPEAWLEHTAGDDRADAQSQATQPPVRLPEPGTLLLVLAGTIVAWQSRRKFV